MIRKSTINLKFANQGKLEKLDVFAKEYQRVVNLFIDELWEAKQFKGSFVKQTNHIESWIAARAKQAASKQALAIVKSQRKKKKKHKPVFNRLAVELDSRFIIISQEINSFDIWIRFMAGDKTKINLPSQKHEHFNKLLNDGWKIKKSIRLRTNENGYFVDIYFEKEAPPLRKIGTQKAIDIGYKKLIVSSDGEFIGNSPEIYEKIVRKNQGSKAFKRALIERDEFVNVSCKTLDLENVKELYAEDLKSVKHKSKGKIRKKFNNKLQRWIYPKVLEKLSMLCEETGIMFEKVPPQYTSQRCCNCGVIYKSNRKGEIYKCACGTIMDADLNASKNILFIGAYGLDALQPTV